MNLLKNRITAIGIATTLAATTLTSCPSGQPVSKVKEIEHTNMKEAEGEETPVYSTVTVQKANGETIETDILSTMLYQTSKEKREILLMYLEKEEGNKKYYVSITNPQIGVIQTVEEEDVNYQMYNRSSKQDNILLESEVIFMATCMGVQSITYELALITETEENERLNELHDVKSFQK